MNMTDDGSWENLNDLSQCGKRCIDDVWHEVDLKISMRGLGSHN